jgi:hypothetical protein
VKTEGYMIFSFALPLLLLGATAELRIAQSAGTVAPTGHLTTRREFHTATLPTNGKVLVYRRWKRFR